MVAEGGQSGIQLAFSAVDQQQIGIHLVLIVHPAIPARDDFVDTAVIVDAFHAADFVAAIPRLEGQSIDELHDAGDGFSATEMRDIDTFDRPRSLLQLEHLAETGEAFFRIDVENFRLGVRQFGLQPMMTLLRRFGLPEVSALHFENRVARIWAEAEAMEQSGRKPPYIGLQQLIEMAEEQEFGGGSSAMVVNNAIRSRLEALVNTRIFARTPREAASLGKAYRQIREGGALVIDISGLSNLARTGFVQSIIELIKDLCVWEIDHDSHRFPFIFFEEAHLYVSPQSIDYIVTRARHLGITSFFVTNMIQGLEEAILRQADNLFLLRIPFEDDVRHVSRGAATDFATLDALVRRLRQRHAVVIGNVTAQFPLMFEVDPLVGVNTAGETRFFFRGSAAR